MRSRPSWRSVAEAVSDLTDAQQRELADSNNHRRNHEHFQRLVIERHCNLLSDKQAAEWLVRQARKSERDASDLVQSIRTAARFVRVEEDEVRLHGVVQIPQFPKVILSEMGQEFVTWKSDLGHMLTRELSDNEYPPGRTCLVSWSGRPLYVSAGKESKQERQEFFRGWAKSHGVPEWCSISEGTFFQVGAMTIASMARQWYPLTYDVFTSTISVTKQSCEEESRSFVRIRPGTGEGYTLEADICVRHRLHMAQMFGVVTTLSVEQ